MSEIMTADEAKAATEELLARLFDYTGDDAQGDIVTDHPAVNGVLTAHRKGYYIAYLNDGRLLHYDPNGVWQLWEPGEQMGEALDE